MHPAIAQHRPGIAAICQRYGIRRLEVFGSAARADDFDPEHSDADFLFTAFAAHEKQAKHLIEQQLALPAYEQVLKAAHTFNLLDARGAISVTERAAYIGRIRNLARAVAQSYYDSRARLGFPLAPREWVEQIDAK